MKRVMFFLFAVCANFAVFADDSGTCGNNLQWSYNGTTHELTITGSGAMTDFSYSLFMSAPWYSCRSEITSVSLPDGLTSIGEYAFRECTGLTSITIPNSVTSIGEYAFSGCSGLTSVTIPNSVTSIGEYAFAGCTSLTNVTIPYSVTSIGTDAFRDCSGLTSVNIKDIAAWCGISFSHYTSNPLYYAQNLYLNGTKVADLIIPNSVTRIGDWAFCKCKGLTSITIPNSVTSIGSGAFFGCSGLTSITIPNSVTSIERSAFAGCTGLTSVTIPNSVTSIENSAFSGCTSLTSITIPNSVTSIESGAFARCCGLMSIVVEQGNTKYDSRNNCNAIIETATNTLIAGCQNTVIPNSVTSIGEYAFSGCSGLKNITIPNSVTSIGQSAFYRCTGLTSITIPESVTSIGYEVFFECTGLTSITIPNSVTSIGYQAFAGCSGLESVVLGNGVKTITPSAFYGCTGLQSITCYSMRPPTVTRGSEPAQFQTLTYSTIVYVPADYQKTYMMHDIWGLYDVRPIGSTTVQTTDLMVTPHYTTADVVWPTVDNAATYELVITQNGTVVCTLVFNAQGQLTSIAFRAPAESARAAGQGFQFTVTGLEDGSAYSLTLNAKDAVGNVLRTFAQDFSTGATALEDVNADSAGLKPRKVIEDGKVIIIMPNDSKYDVAGKRLR